jgi:hypothetical protein
VLAREPHDPEMLDKNADAIVAKALLATYDRGGEP